MRRLTTLALIAPHLFSMVFASQVMGEPLWSLRPVVRPQVPGDARLRESATASNPIDRFVAKAREKKNLAALGTADKSALLRRVSLDLIGLPPTADQLDGFLVDDAPDAYARVVDRLLANPQHGVRYARHWLDVLRYTDVDQKMRAEDSIYLWRDWVIDALNVDRSYDEFVRMQIVGDRTENPADRPATGLLARGDAGEPDQLAFAAVETVSTAFLAMTVGCAKCHDHFFDPISQQDFYAMKALFDPLRLKKHVLAPEQEVAAYDERIKVYEEQKQAIETPMNAFIGPFKQKLFDERVATLPPDVQAIFRKPEPERTPEETKIASDYAPIVRIDDSRIKEIMTAEQIKKYDGFLQRISALKPPAELPVLWAVEFDSKRAAQKSYVLATGDPDQPQEEVRPGFPFAPDGLQFSLGRRQTFLNWLLAADNPLFARVAVNRLWQWHFGVGLVPTSSEFGTRGKKPTHPELLDWLATELMSQDYSMKALHRLMVTSQTYRLASAGNQSLDSGNHTIDPKNAFLWKYRLRRLEAEPIRDGLLFVAGDLDLSIGGKSFRVIAEQTGLGKRGVIGNFDVRSNRRGIYMARGYHQDRDLLPDFLRFFDAEDGQQSSSRRAQTVTAPQALSMLNSDLTSRAAGKVAQRLLQETGGDLADTVHLGYKALLSRTPSASESANALEYLDDDPTRVKGFAWLLMNLDEFIYVP